MPQKRNRQRHNMPQSLITLYRNTFGQEPSIEPLSSAGSNRRYYRLTAPDGQTLIGVEGTNEEENRAFVEIARCFASHDLPTPRVLAVDEANLVYIQEDLGNLSLFDAISHGRSNHGDYNEEEERYHPPTATIAVRGSEGSRHQCFVSFPADGRSELYVRPQLLQVHVPETRRGGVQ